MCGIVGYVGSQEALPILLRGLEALEYRGYDSSGVALHTGRAIEVVRATGKLSALRAVFEQRERPIHATLGIGHTRWATHGRPTETNAHPHSAGRVSLIHNGIIENYLELRSDLERHGSVFVSETDTEVAAHLLNSFLEQGLEPREAMRAMCTKVRGSYAFLAIDSQHPDRILVAKNSTPIIIGLGEKENFVASDITALLPYTRRVVILEDGDLAEVTAGGVTLESVSQRGATVVRPEQRVTWDPITAQKGGFKHFMLKEIYDQGSVLSDTLRGRLAEQEGSVVLPELEELRKRAPQIERVVLLGCGTSWHACLAGKFLIESLAHIPCEVDYAHEFRYRAHTVNRNSVVVAVSQSGETLDTVMALESVVGKATTVALCNVVGASLCRKADMVLYMHAGPELSVASTKAFSTMLVALELFALFLGRERGVITPDVGQRVLRELVQLPQAISAALRVDDHVAEVAKQLAFCRDFLFLGRGICYPMALEGALKLKELSYIHAEGYAAGEMKHGPISLIDEQMPVVVVMQRQPLFFGKTLSNLKEAEARGGRVVVVTDAPEGVDFGLQPEAVIRVPYVSDELSPLLLNIPLQLLAYHVAVFKGTDVDQPRHLAKSVTVE